MRIGESFTRQLPDVSGKASSSGCPVSGPAHPWAGHLVNLLLSPLVSQRTLGSLAKVTWKNGKEKIKSYKNLTKKYFPNFLNLVKIFQCTCLAKSFFLSLKKAWSWSTPSNSTLSKWSWSRLSNRSKIRDLSADLGIWTLVSEMLQVLEANYQFCWWNINKLFKVFLTKYSTLFYKTFQKILHFCTKWPKIARFASC